jgi:hypothetical protein
MKRIAGLSPPGAGRPPSATPSWIVAPLPSRMGRRQATNTNYESAPKANTSGALNAAIRSPAMPGPMSPEML